MISELNQLRKGKQAGFSLPELLTAIAVSAIVFAAIALFVGRGFQIPREQAEQGAIVEEAQTELERLSDTLRNARSAIGDNWLAYAEPCRISILTQADADEAAEVVEYELDDATATFRRRVEGGAWSVIATSVRNDCGTQPVFAYYSLGGGRSLELQSSPPDLAEVDRIVIQLVIDVDPEQSPGAATVNTVVTPREGEEL